MTSQPLSTLARYLDLSLDTSGSVIMMQRCSDFCAIYIGNAMEDQGHWEYRGAIAALIAGDILSPRWMSIQVSQAAFTDSARFAPGFLRFVLLQPRNRCFDQRAVLLEAEKHGLHE